VHCDLARMMWICFKYCNKIDVKT